MPHLHVISEQTYSNCVLVAAAVASVRAVRRDRRREWPAEDQRAQHGAAAQSVRVAQGRRGRAAADRVSLQPPLCSTRRTRARARRATPGSRLPNRRLLSPALRLGICMYL